MLPRSPNILSLDRRSRVRAWAIGLGFAMSAACLPAMGQSITEFSTASVNNVSSGGYPTNIVTGPDGNLWFAQLDGRVGRMTPAGGVTIFSAGLSGVGAPSQTSGICVGPDGNLWLAESSADKVAKITTAGVATEYLVTPGSRPSGIVTGPDGNLWFTESGSGKIGRQIPGGALTEFSAGISANSVPAGITLGPDGNLWFTEIRGPRIARITPQGVVTEFSAGLASGQYPDAITTGPDGNLWFTDVGLNQIGQITTAGVITMFSAGISPGAQPAGITTGPDGNLWFTEMSTGKIGRITPSGVVSEFAGGITPNSSPFAITAGPGGYLWFTEYAVAQIGFIGVGAVSAQTGYWWNPAAAGRGYFIEQQGNNLFAGAFLYDKTGRATWYGIGPGAIVGSTYTGTLEDYANGQTLTGAFQPAMVIGQAGNFSVTFTSPTQGTVTWPGGTETIERYYFGGVNATAPTPGAPQAGWWWAPTEGGRGYAIEIEGDLLYLTGYMYDSSGDPVWYSSGPTGLLQPTAYAGVWQQFGNGQTLTGAYSSPTEVNADVGSITLQFSSTTTGVLTLPDGRQVAIERYSF